MTEALLALLETGEDAAQTHPRPHLRRPWRALDGWWDFALSPAEAPQDVSFEGRIRVPYAPQTPASGLAQAPCLTERTLWYRTRVQLTPQETPGADERLLLHFGAVDWAAQVFVNGAFAARHEGGYTPFTVDVTRAARAGSFELSVRAEDDHADLAQPRGKQDWRAEPHAIWYPPTSGIWRSVWLETVHRQHVQALRWIPDLTRFELTALVTLACAPQPGTRVRLEVFDGERPLADSDTLVTGQHMTVPLRLPDPGVDDARNDLLWLPDHPKLLDVRLTLSVQGRAVDRAEGYAALRSVEARGRRVLLNGIPHPLRMVMHQGYWPDAGMTGDDQRYREDVLLARRLGFNGLRLHQKIEDPRFLYWCDRLGLAVWVDLPSAYAFTAQSLDRLTRTWLEVLALYASHPSVVAWVPFNESWGLPDVARDPAQQQAQRALYSLTRALDPTRLVSGSDGWEQLVSDVFTVHDYTQVPQTLLERYGTRSAVEENLWRLWPGGREQGLAGFTPGDRPVILSEFGGTSWVPAGEDGWGYGVVRDRAGLSERVEALLAAADQAILAKGIHGYCYTQLTDTYQEMNGLADMNRVPKGDVTRLSGAVRGEPHAPGNPLWYSGRWRGRRDPEPH
ncbi:glycoside hydrolase family 2 (plasmid) [Deinococcus taeanensis]|uniref:glycoside hydrolase family 2 protein n=1 Tax=Deinococcus taeanensis TaxID=2737050 RepID=UPI001CDCE793|nr:glycoside hydrolase family 2 TIM barrel-domain containing protein [Deinococcus taeanensis]UBV44256.1 glycoside hydrolase family 2 [Deinococcus taeanensis]